MDFWSPLVVQVAGVAYTFLKVMWFLQGDVLWILILVEWTSLSTKGSIQVPNMEDFLYTSFTAVLGGFPYISAVSIQLTLVSTLILGTWMFDDIKNPHLRH